MKPLLTGSYLAMTAIAVTVNLSPVCVTSLRNTFELSDTAVGFFLSATFWGFNTTLLLSGPLADRFGMRPLLIAAPILQGTGLVTCGTASNAFLLLPGAFLMGTGSGILEVLVNPIVCLSEPKQKTRAVNFCHAFYSIGAVCCILLASALMRSLSWRGLYFLGLLPVLSYAWIYLRHPLPSLQGIREEKSSSRALWRRPLFWLFLAGMLFSGGTELGPAQWAPTFLHDVFAMEDGLAAMGLLIFSASMALGRIGMSRVASFKNRSKLLTMASFFCGALLVGTSLSPAPLFALVSLALLGFFVSVLWPTLLAMSVDAFPNSGATLFSFLGMAGNAGGILFPPLAGKIADHWNIRLAFGGMSFIPLILMAVFLLMGLSRSLNRNETS